MTENLEWREPQAGDLWVKDGDIVMYIFTGHAWLPTQQSLRTDGDGKEEKD